ncbi:MarR family winged helix-turn-helix transcriptional regulator [Actinoplanes friuliensis]|uniref:MarR family transcriptional regulator n=1 Tax=Actinoplanes friuliensis DSM 7358 TaxID=1246995 RepID=U5VTD7_9ACTN|nr:MarR family transcriptional regulator [Actinoplanes friuliensis]AGZ40253.1 MarR family transcriptional regulator [Actinoplanes friuliensis DSM 7358]
MVAVKESLREARNQLSVFSRQVGTRLELKDADLDCLDLIDRAGPLSPTALARLTGLHPATLTGILDRLDRGGWVVRERAENDRRAVLIRSVGDRKGELYALLAGMNRGIDEICAGYSPAELEVIADFLRRTAETGRQATGDL